MRGPTNREVGARARVNPRTGQVSAPQPIYPLLPLTGAEALADGWGQTAYTLPAVNGATASHVVHVSKRSLITSRWLLGFPANSVADADIVRRNGTGQGFNVNERWNVSYLGDVFGHNPTFAGAISSNGQTNGIDPWPDNTDHDETWHSPALHFLVKQSNNELIVEGAVMPLDFNTAGIEHGNGASDYQALAPDSGVHSADRDCLSLWDRCVQFQRHHYNWKPDVHRFLTWVFSPVDWLDDCSADVTWCGISLTDMFSPAAGMYDAPRKLLTTFDSIVPGLWSGLDRQNFEIKGKELWLTETVVAVVPTPFTSRVATAVVTSGDRYLAMMCFLSGSDEGNACSPRNAPSTIKMRQERAPSHNPPGYNNIGGQFFGVETHSTSGREAGWIGCETLVVTKGSQAELLEACDEIYRSRVLERPRSLEQEVPRHLIDRTRDLWPTT